MGRVSLVVTPKCNALQ